MTEKDDAPIKKMAELLRGGASMLAQACPQCGSPLMKVQDDIYCATCDRRIVIVDSEEEAESEVVKAVLPELQERLLTRLRKLSEVIESEDNTEELTKLVNLMVLLLQALEKIGKMGTGK
jgi:UPF0148 protein